MSDDPALDDFYAELRRHHLEALWRINTKIMPFEPQPRAKAWLWRYEDLARLAELAGKLVPIDRGGDRRVLAAINPGLVEAYGDCRLRRHRHAVGARCSTSARTSRRPATGTARRRCASSSRARGRGRPSTATVSPWPPATSSSPPPTPGTTTRTTPTSR